MSDHAPPQHQTDAEIVAAVLVEQLRFPSGMAETLADCIVEALRVRHRLITPPA